MDRKKFCLTVSKKNIANQVAQLLNLGGQLGGTQRSSYVLSNNVTYYIEIEKEKVIGVIGLEKKSQLVSEIKHLCVHPIFRNKGIGKKLINKALEKAETPFVYEIIRENNYPNIHNSLKTGFKPIAVSQGINCKLILFARERGVAYGVSRS